MRRFLLTIPGRFKGAIELQYKDGKLWKIDFSRVDVSPEIVSWFKKGVPVLVENMNQYAEATGVTVNEAEFEVTFQDFRREYPLKRNMHLAEAYWPRISSSIQYLYFIAAMEYSKHCEKEKAWYKPMLPEKFLKTEQYKNIESWRD